MLRKSEREDAEEEQSSAGTPAQTERLSGAFTFVPDAALPVLGCLPAADKLELVGGEPLSPVPDRGSFAPLAQLIDVEQRLVLPALHLDARLSVVKEGLEIRDRGKPLQHQVLGEVVGVVGVVRVGVVGLVEAQVRAVGKDLVVSRRVRGYHRNGSGGQRGEIVR